MIKAFPSLSVILFSGVVAIAEFIGVFLTTIQGLALKPAVVVGAVATVLEFFGDPFGFAEDIFGVLIIIFGAQLFLALIVLCIFYAIVLASPKGSYTVYDCLVAAGVFIMESIPFFSFFTGWVGFLFYLKWRRRVRLLAGGG